MTEPKTAIELHTEARHTIVAGAQLLIELQKLLPKERDRIQTAIDQVRQALLALAAVEL